MEKTLSQMNTVNFASGVCLVVMALLVLIGFYAAKKGSPKLIIASLVLAVLGGLAWACLPVIWDKIANFFANIFSLSFTSVAIFILVVVVVIEYVSSLTKKSSNDAVNASNQNDFSESEHDSKD